MVIQDPEPTIVGVQDIFAKNFVTTRVAESGSWLGLAHQGKGIGKEMRAAVLHLAFAGLGARWMETFAWEDNASSLGVTERLGYEPNGVEMDLRRGEGQPLRRFRMTREAWEGQRRKDIRIEGLEHCLDMFGLPQAVAGADACRGGWCVVTLPVEGDATVEVVDRLAKVATRQAKGQLGAVGVDIPIGLSDGPPRKCDLDARALLGDRRSSVFPAPVRPVLGARSYEAALARSREAGGVGLSKQSWNLVPKIAEVDRLLDPTRQGRIFEVHPEVAFARLHGVPMAHPKKSRPGRDERLAVLRPHVPGHRRPRGQAAVGRRGRRRPRRRGRRRHRQGRAGGQGAPPRRAPPRRQGPGHGDRHPGARLPPLTHPAGTGSTGQRASIRCQKRDRGGGRHPVVQLEGHGAGGRRTIGPTRPGG